MMVIFGALLLFLGLLSLVWLVTGIWRIQEYSSERIQRSHCEVLNMSITGTCGVSHEIQVEVLPYEGNCTNSSLTLPRTWMCWSLQSHGWKLGSVQVQSSHKCLPRIGDRLECFIDCGDRTWYWKDPDDSQRSAVAMAVSGGCIFGFLLVLVICFWFPAKPFIEVFQRKRWNMLINKSTAVWIAVTHIYLTCQEQASFTCHCHSLILREAYIFWSVSTYLRYLKASRFVLERLQIRLYLFWTEQHDEDSLQRSNNNCLYFSFQSFVSLPPRNFEFYSKWCLGCDVCKLAWTEKSVESVP